MTRQRPFADDIATGTPTAGFVPISAGAGAPPVWGAGGEAGLPRCSAALRGTSLIIPPLVSMFVPTGYDVPLDEDEFDPDNWHDEGTASPTIIVPDEGDYLISGRFEWDTVDTTDPQSGTARQLRIVVTGGWGARSLLAPQQMGSLAGMSQEVNCAVHLSAGATVKLTVAHDADGDMTYDSNGNRCPRLSVVKLG